MKTQPRRLFSSVSAISGATDNGERCNRTGYKGRKGLFELLVMNDELRDMVMRNASTEDLREAARRAGMVTLRDSGMESIFNGETTADEVIRETILEA